ncbi:cytidylate kinase [Johnsonella ignava ATCC 51276]|uniref:Cytidylate kinase n=1 Tax=Johnsonella ignava ATCC 51276 TaxID=679200 RepID=G5GFN3_9FIRM|nr:(d)CMP kinase [Johnsonella ignava]EHI56510.1 cytidylate kinase [Johnsonella ignava ATCC 51276]
MRSIAIDGPAGAGKSSIAKEISKKTGFVYVDTGAMFRALGLYFIKKGIKLEDETAVARLLDDIDIKVVYKDEEQRIMLSGEDVTGHLRSEEAAGAASSLSVYSAVREKLLCVQRDIAKQYNVVMDGRDIGTKVLPDADVKIYLTAGIKERAKRRFFELVQKGEKPDIKKIERDMQDRDYRDMHRKNSPLAKAEDAYEIDTTDMTIKEVVEKILDIAALTG